MNKKIIVFPLLTLLAVALPIGIEYIEKMKYINKKLFTLPYSNKVTKEFQQKLISICYDLGINPVHLMSLIHFESMGTFSSKIVNNSGTSAGYDGNGKLVKAAGIPDDTDSYKRAKYRATGMLQIMPKTAVALGTTTQNLYLMSDIEYLNYVKKYFMLPENKNKKRDTLIDLYMIIFYPAANGKPLSYVFPAYITPQNSGFDGDKNGFITKQEIYNKLFSIYNIA